MMAPDDRRMLLQKALFIIGVLVAFVGVGLTLVLSMADMLRGEPVHIGDAQLVAVIGGIILTAGGVFLVLMALDLGVRNNLERLSQTHVKFKPGRGRVIWRMLWPPGAVVALVGMAISSLFAGMDVLEGKTVSIGGYQEAVVLASLAIVFMGLMFMALGTLQAAIAYDPILLQLQAFRMIEPGDSQARPGPETVVPVQSMAPQQVVSTIPMVPGSNQPVPDSLGVMDMPPTSTLYYSPDRVELGIPAPFKGPSAMAVEDRPANEGPAMVNAGGGGVTEVMPAQPTSIGEGDMTMGGSQGQVIPIAHTEDTGTMEEAPVGEVTAEIATTEAEGPWVSTGRPDGTSAMKEDGNALDVLEWPSIAPSEDKKDQTTDHDNTDEAAQPETGLIENIVERSVLDDILKNISSTQIEEIEGMPHFEDKKGEDEGMMEMEVEREVIEDRRNGTPKDAGTPNTRICPGCGQPLRSDWRMCPYCDQVLPY